MSEEKPKITESGPLIISGAMTVKINDAVFMAIPREDKKVLILGPPPPSYDPVIFEGKTFKDAVICPKCDRVIREAGSSEWIAVIGTPNDFICTECYDETV